MTVVVSVDLGTTKITSLAVDAEEGKILAHSTTANDANITNSADRARGRSEWNAHRIVDLGLKCLRESALGLGDRGRDIVGVGITGQQHGVVLVDSQCAPVSPLINWQDRRALEQISTTGRSYLETARDRVGETAVDPNGCRLQAGFMATTLFWLKENGLLLLSSRACFIMDLFGAALTGAAAVTEPSCAASSGLLDVRKRSWNLESIRALGLSEKLFPELREANRTIGTITETTAAATGLRIGTPVFAPIGDHQASFLGSVGDLHEHVLVNVGTGAQVAVFADDDRFTPPVELRPFPIRGNLLSNVGLAGGWSYQVLENFFRRVAVDALKIESPSDLYSVMDHLAVEVPAGCGGLRCDPHFAGSRADPDRRGAFVGLTPQNFTPAYFARAVMEGMAQSLADGYRTIQGLCGRSHRRIVGAGNALRENPVLRESVRAAFGLELGFTSHREEAAFGAALTASVGAGVYKTLEEAAASVKLT